MSDIIRGEIKTYIDGLTLSETPAVVNDPFPFMDLSELTNTLRVLVYPLASGKNRDAATRRGWDKLWRIGVAVQEKIDLDTTAGNDNRVKSLILFGDELENALEDFASASTSAIIETFEERPPFVPAHLEEWNQVTVAIGLTINEYAP